MKAITIKRYRLGVSRTFPETHPRKWDETYFFEKILAGMLVNKNFYLQDVKNPFDREVFFTCIPKIHTIRSNYPLWKKRMKEVQAGNAVIELFYWSGKPYRSPQVVFATLDKDSGCGVQQLIWSEDNSMNMRPRIFESCKVLSENELSLNDGLLLNDFKDWFKSYNLSKPMAIIHFTSFRY